MCGVLGYWSVQEKISPSVRRAVGDATDRLHHRGPDDRGVFVSGDARCALGHTRLSILDLSRQGRQPMTNEDETVWLVFNGEIYNFRDLRRALTEKGHRFRSTTDTEVLVHLYEEEGPELVHRLDGMFAFVVYDEARGRLFGARDRFGVKPLYYAWDGERFAFASEPKALLSLPDVSRAPDRSRLSAYLAFNCVPAPGTLYEEVRKLEPGTRFTLDRSSGLRVERYWVPAGAAASRDGGESQATGVEPSVRLEETLLRATEKRMMSDVPFGALLSGGLDSSLNVALMAEVLEEPVRTFTIGYPGDDDRPESDLHAARRMAEEFGTCHHEFVATNEDILSALDELPSLCDDPVGAPSVTANLLAAQHARSEGVKVVQVGEGADELFCGYGSLHKLWRLERRFGSLGRRVPRRLARGAAWALEPLSRAAGGISLTGALDETVSEQLRRFGRGEQVHWGFGVLFNRGEQERLFAGEVPPSDPYVHLARRIEAQPRFHEMEYLDRLILLETFIGLPERLLMRVDKATMRFGLEARVPFLDPRVAGVVFGTEPERRAKRPKALLREVAARRLPSYVLDRPKQGFPTAREVFLARPVLARLSNAVLDEEFLEFTGFHRERVQHYFDIARRGDHTYFYHIWSLYVLAVWFQTWTSA